MLIMTMSRLVWGRYYARDNPIIDHTRLYSVRYMRHKCYVVHASHLNVCHIIAHVILLDQPSMVQFSCCV